MRFLARGTAAALGVAAAVALAGGGCAARPKGPVIVYLVSRQHVTVVTSGPRGPVYTVRQRSGDTLVEGLSLPELRSRHPRLYREIVPVLATHGRHDDGAGDDNGHTIDASLGHDPAAPEWPQHPAGDAAAGA